ncbi:hypothetical protein NT2_01_02880 [Caenibius tardaugens NBRC 16725]|uniref:Uncharacterized protein n=1 Tax=Caenibius tardaugens NBRC 16725 TaxID=1219035 RepID=U2ZQ73_9SPHN|nr:hypothetical protein NT2_01_02880 [Caenibius tardaugens NBRC 16725]
MPWYGSRIVLHAIEIMGMQITATYSAALDPDKQVGRATFRYGTLFNDERGPCTV